MKNDILNISFDPLPRNRRAINHCSRPALLGFSESHTLYFSTTYVILGLGPFSTRIPFEGIHHQPNGSGKQLSFLFFAKFYNGCPRISIDFYAWISMDIHGCPWMFMDIHGYPWISMDIHGSPSICMHG